MKKSLSVRLTVVFIILAVVVPLKANLLSSDEKTIDVDYKGYLFVYFTGNNIKEEAVHYALSTDGYSYYALNNNKPVILSQNISSTGGIRDPHILRSEEGNSFYMVVTDMVSTNGWNSNRAMVLLKSVDLIRWTSHVVDIQKRFPGNETLLRVWAPQTIYDEDAGKYLVYWSMKHGDGPDIIYYAYANESFSDLEGTPKQLFFPANGKSCIDGDIVKYKGIYHLFYKTEGDGNGIKKATSLSLTSAQWKEEDNYLNVANEAAEGSSVFKLLDDDGFILMYDRYMDGKYRFLQSEDLKHFVVSDDKININFHPRHGTIIPITGKEIKILLKTWGIPKGFTLQE